MPVALQNDATFVWFKKHSDDYRKHKQMQPQSTRIASNWQCFGNTGHDKTTFQAQPAAKGFHYGYSHCTMMFVQPSKNAGCHGSTTIKTTTRGTWVWNGVDLRAHSWLSSHGVPWVQAPLAHAWAPNLPTQDVLLMLCLSVKHRGKAGLV